MVNDDRAEQGISMMIVYVSLVLVAAVAGAVVIQNAAKLREKSERTGAEVARQISSNLQLISARGERATTADDLDTLVLLISPAAASAPLDLFRLSVLVQVGDLSKGYLYTDAAPGSGLFNTTELRDIDDSHQPGQPLMNSGDLIYVNIDLSADGLSLAARDIAEITIFPEVGTPVPITIEAPSSFGDDLVVSLR